MADPRDIWAEFGRNQALADARRRQLEALQQGQQRPLTLDWDITAAGVGGWRFLNHLPPPPNPAVATGGLMITLFPEKEEFNKDELTHVRTWIGEAATGKKKAWPGYALAIRVNGRGRYVTSGVWECRDGDNYLYVGNGTGTPVPLWAPSALMAIARFYHLEDDKELVGKVHEMLATIIAKDILPVVTDLAIGFNGNSVTEIAVNKKERIFAGRYPDEKGNPGPWRLLTGEIVEINDKDWIVMKM